VSYGEIQTRMVSTHDWNPRSFLSRKPQKRTNKQT
jgi:hypothetical protein